MLRYASFHLNGVLEKTGERPQKKLDKGVVRRGPKKKAGRNSCPLRCLDGRNGRELLAVLVYFPEVVELLAGCEFALGMLM